MRRDYRYVYEVSDEELAILDAWGGNRGAFSFEAVLETGDAPPEVLEVCRQRIEHRADWEAGAKDRPFSFAPVVSMRAKMRLFDGPWFPVGAISDAVEANVPIPFNPRLGIEPMFERHTALPWKALEDLAWAKDEQSCRRIAAAVYEYLELRERAARVLVHTVNNELERRALEQVVATFRMELDREDEQ